MPFADWRKEPTPPASGAEAYRAQALTSTVLHAASSDPGRIRAAIPRARPLTTRRAPTRVARYTPVSRGARPYRAVHTRCIPRGARYGPKYKEERAAISLGEILPPFLSGGWTRRRDGRLR